MASVNYRQMFHHYTFTALKNTRAAGFMHTTFTLFAACELDTLHPARVRLETFSM